MKRLAGLLVWASLILPACAPSAPSLERDAGGEWVPAAGLELDSLRGARDGDRVSATARLLGEGIDIELFLELFIEPPARFVEGRYRARIGDRALEGPLGADWVDFLGGQSTAGSVGGAYVLDAPADGPRYRVRFPATLMERIAMIPGGFIGSRRLSGSDLFHM